MRWLALLLAFASSYVCASTPSYITFPSDIDWVTQETPHFQILYRRGSDQLAQRTLQAAEKAHALLMPIFQEAPPKTWIVLSDFHDSLNGYAIDFPFPHFVVFASPPEPSSQLATLDKWLDSVVLHEYVHVLHLYPAHGFWAGMKTVFGSWVLPNGMLPAHLHEGLATFLETEFSRGGRGRSASFSMLTRMAVKKGVWGKEFVPLDLLEGSTRWPQGVSPYYFGYQIYSELWARKKAPGLHAFVRHTSQSLLPYWLSHSTRQVYGEDYPSLWKSVFEKNQSVVEKQIQEIESRALSPLKYSTQSGYSKWDTIVSNDGKALYYRQNHPDSGTTLERMPLEATERRATFELEAGNQEGLCEIRQGDDSFLFFTETDWTFQYQNNVLRVLTADFKNKKTPLSDGKPLNHVHALACGLSNELLIYQETAGSGHVGIWKWDSTQGTLQLLRQWNLPAGTWITSLSVDSSRWLTLREGVSTAFYRWDDAPTPRLVNRFQGHFYRLGKTLSTGELPLIADISGREEVWAVHPEKKTGRKLISVLGGINSFATLNNNWWVSSYEHGGYDIAQTSPGNEKARPLPLAAPEVGQNLTDGQAQSYSPWSTLLPKAWLPSFLIVPGGAQISAWVPGFDVAQKHVYNLFGGYDTRGSPFFIGDYSYRFGLSQEFQIDLNYLPTYLIRSANFLHSWGASVGYNTRLGKDLPWLSLSAIFRRVEKSALGGAVQSVGLSVGLSNTFWLKTTPRGIAPLRATTVSISHAQYFKALGSRDDFFVSTAAVDQYLKVPFTQRHVLKMGGRFGITQGTVLYNSFFQGGGELQFSSGRGFFLNRGFLPGAFLNRKMLALNLDYLFPIVDVQRGPGLWPFFLKRIEGALVLDVLSQNDFQKYYYSAGLEVKTQWKTFFYFPTAVRFGAYHALHSEGEPLYLTMAIEATL